MSSAWTVEPIPPQLYGTPAVHGETNFSLYPEVSDYSLKQRVWSGWYAVARLVGAALLLPMILLYLFEEVSGGPPWWFAILCFGYWLGFIYSKTREHAHMTLLAEEIARVNEQCTQSSIADAAYRLRQAHELNEVGRQQSLDLMQAQAKVHQLCRSAEVSFGENYFRRYWESIELAVYEMDQASKLATSFGQTAKHYRANLEGRTHNLPTFAQLASNLPTPDPRSMTAEFERVLRLGETNRDFAGYLNERVTIKVLVEGFKTLEEVLAQCGRFVFAILKQAKPGAHHFAG